MLVNATTTTKIDTSNIDTSVIIGSEITQCRTYLYTGKNRKLKDQTRCNFKIDVTDPKQTLYIPGTDLIIQIGSEVKTRVAADDVLSVTIARSIRTPGMWLVDVTIVVPTPTTTKA
ncbi:hypothetical protein [Shimazuella kribbensis]|uniref:hypothetical protein n=1 Tax=Shimazuella kribbensis TaxID=139808 RepID=UPI0012EC1DE5|nr:hypothetical protein [Shimazuella kribbensis]